MEIGKKGRVLVLLSILCLFCFTAIGSSQEKYEGTMVIKIVKKGLRLEGTAGKAETGFSGEIVYEIVADQQGMRFELNSLGLVGLSVESQRGKTGNISINLKPGSARTKYDPRERVLESEFLAEVHYPLIDRIKGYMPPSKGEKEIDYYRSYTETFAGKLICKLIEIPRVDDPMKVMKMKKGSTVKIQMKMKEKVLGEIIEIIGLIQEIDVAIFPLLFLKRFLKVQPVFIRYTPDQGCFGSSTTATTGGSFTILRDKSIEMWKRCCIGLKFLSPVYIDDNDYRILSSTEEANLRAEYDDPNAVEVFFVEVSDPVGLHGGGACYSLGTASTQIITYDTNLPINLYNLAHELGHALGLYHPPGNSTSGSLMEPSGFCADNPALMSDENCDNASNPLLYTSYLFFICKKNTNMP